MRDATYAALSDAISAFGGFLEGLPPQPSEVEALRDRAVEAVAVAVEAIRIDLSTPSTPAMHPAENGGSPPADGGGGDPAATASPTGDPA